MGINAKEFLSDDITGPKETEVAGYLKLLVSPAATLNQDQLIHMVNEVGRLARMRRRDRQRESTTIVATWINSCRN